jgi:hypothetical protein
VITPTKVHAPIEGMRTQGFTRCGKRVSRPFIADSPETTTCRTCARLLNYKIEEPPEMLLKATQAVLEATQAELRTTQKLLGIYRSAMPAIKDFRDLVHKHYFAKEPEFDPFYLDSAIMTLTNVIKLTEELDKSEEKEALDGTP